MGPVLKFTLHHQNSTKCPRTKLAYSTYGEIHKTNFVRVWNTKLPCSPHSLWWLSCPLNCHPNFISTCKGNNLLYCPFKVGNSFLVPLSRGMGVVLGNKPGTEGVQGRECDRSQQSEVRWCPNVWGSFNCWWNIQLAEGHTQWQHGGPSAPQYTGRLLHNLERLRCYRSWPSPESI